MKPFLAGFVDELTKVGGVSARRLLRDSDDPTATDIAASEVHSPKSYARTAIVGAIIAPVMTVLSRSLGRFVHNRGVMHAMGNIVRDGWKHGTPGLEELGGSLRRGPLLGPGFGHAPGHAPLLSHSDLAQEAFGGAAGGTIVQSIRDRLLNPPDKR